MTTSRSITTRSGKIEFPTYIPVTTFGDRYPLDHLIAPYLPRLASAIMVSYYYARQMEAKPRLPMLIDSGGFASLFANATVVQEGELGSIRIAREQGDEVIDPLSVLELQERIADIAFSLDFPIPPALEAGTAIKRMDLTIANAHWALANRRRRDLPLYACVQAFDAASASACARAYAKSGFDGIAIGGLVPRARNLKLVFEIVEAVRAEIGSLPLHVFGLGKPEVVKTLFEIGVDSVDSSAYVKAAADGRLWSQPGFKLDGASPTERLHLALCNLAAANGRSLPLSTLGVTYSTALLSHPRPPDTIGEARPAIAV